MTIVLTDPDELRRLIQEATVEAVETYRAPELLTIEEAAEAMRLSPKTLRQWIAAGRFPAVELGGSIRIAVSDMRRYIREHRREAV